MSNDLEILPHDDGMAVAQPLSFIVPLDDLATLADLPMKRQTEVRVLLPILARVHALLGANSLEQACRTVAAASRHLMCGLSAGSLRRKYNTYAASGQWRDLVRGFKGPNKQPREFALEIRRATQENRVSQTEALNRLRERWAAGETIPGYGNWMERYQIVYPDRPLPKVFPRTFYPAGWSPRNLYRYTSNKGARTLYTRGLAAAKKYYPTVNRDPSALRPLEMIVIDDFELDCMCAFSGDAEHKPQVGRVAGLLAIDVATRRKLHWVLGQRLERHEVQPDGTIKTVKAGISRIDTQLFLHGLFAKTGLPPYPVTILSEEDRAAAGIGKELKLSIETLFNGRVTVDYTGILEHRNLENGFGERGGRPWIKGWIESGFAGLWKILGTLRGYKGNNERLAAPAELKDALDYTKLLFGQGDRALDMRRVTKLAPELKGLIDPANGALNLPPQLLAQLRVPFENLETLTRLFAGACGLCDRRDNHKYIGFDRVTEWTLDDGMDPQPFAALALLPAEQQTQVTLIERMESPVERWTRLTQEVQFTAIDPAVLAVFMLTPKRVTYRNRAITFLHDRRGKREGFSFVDRDGTVLGDVQDGTEFLGYFDPEAPDRLHVTQLNGARTGTLTRLGGKRGMVDIRDKAALAEAGAIQRTLINRDVAGNRELHAETNVLVGAERENNAQIIAAHQAETAGLTPGERFARAATTAAATAMAQQEASKADAAAVHDRAKGQSLAEYL